MLTGRIFWERKNRARRGHPPPSCWALAHVSIEQAEALQALATALLDMARTLLRTTEDTGTQSRQFESL